MCIVQNRPSETSHPDRRHHFLMNFCNDGTSATYCGCTDDDREPGTLRHRDTQAFARYRVAAKWFPGVGDGPMRGRQQAGLSPRAGHRRRRSPAFRRNGGPRIGPGQSSRPPGDGSTRRLAGPDPFRTPRHPAGSRSLLWQGPGSSRAARADRPDLPGHGAPTWNASPGSPRRVAIAPPS